MIDILNGDCLDVLKSLPNDSVDSIVTDPPAGIAFMGKDWDKDKGGRDNWIAWMSEVAEECLRVIKPGGHALVWALPRTSHWTGMAWENGGWEPRDKCVHLFGSGFPKSLDISKAIDKAAGAEREVVGYKRQGTQSMFDGGKPRPATLPATLPAKQWEGWGTALKPGHEDWWIFRKPLAEKTVANNVLEHGTGGLNIDGCRVGMGRFPANVTHDGSDVVVAVFPVTTATPIGGRKPTGTGGNGMFGGGWNTEQNRHADSGSAARFFYCAKASKRDRDEGLDGFELRDSSKMSGGEETRPDRLAKGMTNHPLSRNHHPTVKNTELMRYFCRLITPPGGTILDPFCGSGSTGKGAVLEGFNFIGIEQDTEYAELARARIAHAMSLVGLPPDPITMPIKQKAPIRQLSLFT